MFGLGGRKKFEAQVSVLLRDLDQFGHISPYAASSKTSNDFRLNGLTEHETALGLCLTHVISLFSAGEKLSAINLFYSARENTDTWLLARVVRPDIVQEFFAKTEEITGLKPP